MENRNIEELLLRFYTGEATVAEKEAIEEWLLQSEENRTIADDIYYIYLAADTLSTLQTIDAKADLKVVKKKIRKKQARSWFNWMQRIAAALFIPLLIGTCYLVTKSEPMEYIEIRTNPGMVTSFNLPDGSKVWLNSSSYLRYPMKFNGNLREIELEGEAYFKVEKDQSKKFIVHTGKEVDVEVLGTEFNLEAYPKDSCVKTILVSGEINLIYKTKDKQEQNLLMKPNQRIIYNCQLANVESQSIFVACETAWKDGKVVLRNTSMEEVLHMLNKRFDADFILKNPALKYSHFTGTFDSQQLTKILEHLRISSNIRYKIIEPSSDNMDAPEKTRVELY